jgi:uncharacterized protein YigE (DUF2233 family)
VFARFSIYKNPVVGLILAAVLAMAGFAFSPQSRGSACIKLAFEGQNFVVCTYDLRIHELKLILRGGTGSPLRSLSALSSQMAPAERSRVHFGMNAGMYDEKSLPIGLYVEAGRTLHRLNHDQGHGNFFLKPNGIFWLDRKGVPHVESTPVYARAKRAPDWATQSGPMLLMNGKLHPKIAPDGLSHWNRNGVGIGPDGRAYFVISDRPVSFGRFARFFRDALHCQDALFLDGSVSSLWDPATGRQDSHYILGPILLVSRR